MTFRKKWPFIFGILLICSMLPYFMFSQMYGDRGTKILTTINGIVGLFIIVLLVLYNIRKKIYGTVLGSTQSWLLFHIYVGIFSVFIVLIHADLTISGTFSAILFILFIIVISSGIVGLLIYKSVPLALSKYGRDVFTAEEIKNKIKYSHEEAERAISEMSIESKRFYAECILPMFKSERTKWEYLIMEEKAVLNRQNRIFEDYMRDAPKKEVYALKLLISPVLEKEKLKFMLVKIKLLKVWLNIHVPLTGALLTAVIIHVLLTIYF